MVNSVDPDQMPHSAASDLGLHCLQRPICSRLLRVIMVPYFCLQMLSFLSFSLFFSKVYNLVQLIMI